MQAKYVYGLQGQVHISYILCDVIRTTKRAIVKMYEKMLAESSLKYVIRVETVNKYIETSLVNHLRM
jgi:hypothetical protein